MSEKVNIAILGATGNVGRMFLRILEERNFPINNLKLLSSEKSAGSKIKFQGKEYTVELATKDSFKDIDIVLASAGGTISKELAPHAVKAGAVVIDNSSYYRMDKDVPLVVAGVNNHALKNHKGIIANPNCTTAQLVPALKALDKLAGLKRVVISTYQSVSGAGKAAIDELTEQSQDLLSRRDVACNVSTARNVSTACNATTMPNRKFAFNVIPHIDVFSDDDYTKEEIKVINESRKILDLPGLRITCTAARVPVYVGHSESVNVELEKSITREDIVETFRKMPLIEVIDDPSNSKYPMAIDIADKDPVYIGRIRKDNSNPNTFNMWIVADNLRIGAALNAIRIAEVLIQENLILNKSI